MKQTSEILKNFLAGIWHEEKSTSGLDYRQLLAIYIVTDIYDIEYSEAIIWLSQNKAKKTELLSFISFPE